MDMANEFKGSIVIVDDNPNNLQVLSSILKSAGHQVRPALSGEAALRAIAHNLPDLILLDIMMPGMNGYETCKVLKDDINTRNIPVIFISALNELGDKVLAFQAGAVDYLSKPFQAEEVIARVNAHLKLQLFEQHLKAMVDAQTRELQLAINALQKSQQQYHLMLEQSIEAIALTVEKRDPYTAGHQVRVSQLATAIARELDFSADRLEGLRLGATIHDIGKIYIPAEILSRPGRLSATEFDLIKTHSEVGFEIVRNISFPWPIDEMILQHHERLDGSGYPKGLKGEEIIKEALILSVADVVEAIASHRPYRPAMGIDKALEEISNGSGRIYHPEVVEACLSLFNNNDYQLPPSPRFSVG